jgi:hypothetical protein
MNPQPFGSYGMNVLENDCIRLILNPDTGGFQSVVLKVTGHEFIGAPDRASLFRLMVPEGDRQYLHRESGGASIHIEGQTAHINYVLEGAEARATLALDGNAVDCSLEIRNTGSLNIEEIQFPCVRGLGPMEGASVIWPCCFASRKVDNPFAPKNGPQNLGGDHITWNQWTQKTMFRYPQHLASAWYDYGNASQGIAIEGRHTDFSMMDFFLHKAVEKRHAPDADDPVRRSLDMVTCRPRRVRPGESFTSGPVRILVHEGDWHAAADSHRAWLETWVQKPDRPAKFAEAIGWHFYFMKHQDGLERFTYADLPAMARASLEAGCPYLLLFGWQTGGHDNNYMYRYVPNEDWGGAEALRKAVAEVRALGVEPMPFYNGTLANTELEEHKAFGHKWEAKTRAGHPYYAGDWARHNRDSWSRNRAMLHHEIAPCREHREYFVETVRRIVQDYGFGNTQLDQMAEKMLVDYNEDHIETTPDRVYVDGIAWIMPRVREAVRQANPGGVVITECFNDFTGQWSDSSWCWNLLLPFPEPLLYTLPWLLGSHEIDALEYDEVNKAFAYKLHLDMKIDGGDGMVSDYPKFAAHVKANADLRRRVAPYYAHADFRDQENISVEGPESVLVKVYHNRAGGKVGIVVAETAGEAAHVAVTSAWETRGEARLDSNRRAAETVASSGGHGLDLEPYEVRVIGLDVSPV